METEKSGGYCAYKKFKRTITSWKTSTFEIYKLAFEKYGGSVNMHPDVVSFFMKNHAWKIDFFHYEKNGDIKAHTSCAMERKLA